MHTYCNTCYYPLCFKNYVLLTFLLYGHERWEFKVNVKLVTERT
jgi:hypothetical protein